MPRPKLQIQYPTKKHRGDKAVPNVFLAVVRILDTVNVDSVTGTLKCDANEVEGEIIKMDKESATHPLNHRLKFLKFNTGVTKMTDCTLEVTGLDGASNEVPDSTVYVTGIDTTGGILQALPTFDYPPDNHTIDENEALYFPCYGSSDTSVISVTLPGETSWFCWDSTSKDWYGEFYSLASTNGPVSLTVTNSGSGSNSRTVTVV